MSSVISGLREFGRKVLERRFGRLDEVKGQGVHRGTRFRFSENGKTLTCAIKAAARPSGKIHFSYKDGLWDTLSEVDRILYVRPAPERPGQLEAQMYVQKVILDAFNANRRAAEEKGFTNLPAWLTPDHESHERNFGSGFGQLATWREFSGDSEPDSTPTDIGPIISGPSPTFAVAVERAKTNLALELGISTSRIEIVIRT